MTWHQEDMIHAYQHWHWSSIWIQMYVCAPKRNWNFMDNFRICYIWIILPSTMSTYWSEFQNRIYSVTHTGDVSISSMFSAVDWRNAFKEAILDFFRIELIKISVCWMFNAFLQRNQNRCVLCGTHTRAHVHVALIRCKVQEWQKQC